MGVREAGDYKPSPAREWESIPEDHGAVVMSWFVRT